MRDRPVRILFLADAYETERAGTERQLRTLIAQLDRTRYEPRLALLRGDATAARAVMRCPVDVVGVGRLRSAGSLLAIARYAWRARRGGHRLVHCFFNDASLVAPLFRWAGMRVIVSRRDMGIWYTPAIARVLPAIVPFVDRYVANSRAVAALVCRAERVPEDRIRVIHNGRGEPSIRESARERGHAWSMDEAAAPVVGVVANLRPVKRIDTLIEALALLRGRCPRLRALVVGADTRDEWGSSMRDRLVALARRYGVARRIEFLGEVADPAPLVSRFSVAVLCSESEGLSNALIEYMQAARPIVCTRVGGNPELIVDGVDGLLVAVGDAEALADAIERLLRDRALAQRLGEAARESVQAKCSDERMAAEHMSCYDEVMSARARTFRAPAGSASRRSAYRC